MENKDLSDSSNQNIKRNRNISNHLNSQEEHKASNLQKKNHSIQKTYRSDSPFELQSKSYKLKEQVIF